MAETTHHSRAISTLVIAVGGLDSSGGAGLIRDYLTGAALGARVAMVGTAWTLQSPGGPAAIDARAPDHLQQAVTGALIAAGARAAVKVGMLADAAQAGALLSALQGFGGPVVVDPVLVSSAGAALYRGDPAHLLPLLARATVVTPNLAEAATLTGMPVTTTEEARAAAQELLRRGARGVLVKGGHLAGDANDLLIWDPQRVPNPPRWTPAGKARLRPTRLIWKPDPGHEPERFEWLFPAPRIPGRSPRGTGCALATAIAVGLAAGQALPQAVLAAKTWLHERIAGARAVEGEWLL